MSETFGSALERLRDIVGDQTVGYRRLLETTREGLTALRTDDLDRFDELLAEQVETMRELKDLERARDMTIRQVGTPPRDSGLTELNTELKQVVSDLARANRVSRFVIERNGALVEARLGLHRRAGQLPAKTAAGVDERV